MNKTLYMVATPIGNLGDVSQRVLDILKNVDLILVEDTRRSQILFNHFGIKTPYLSLHKFNEKERLNKIQELFEKDLALAIISDAGTPAIADPGSLIVEYSLNNQIKVVPIPGPSALTALLSASGIHNGAITFIGFLPHKKTERIKTIISIGNSNPPHSFVFFESPKRIKSTLEILAELIPDSIVVLGRELTKIHEEILRFEAKNYPKEIKEKGEFTILVNINKNYNNINKVTDFSPKMGEPRKIATILANYLKIKPKEAYNILVKLKEENNK